MHKACLAPRQRPGHGPAVDSAQRLQEHQGATWCSWPGADARAPPALEGKECQPLPIAVHPHPGAGRGPRPQKAASPPGGAPRKLPACPEQEGHPGAPCALWTAGPDGTRQTAWPWPGQPPPRPKQETSPRPGPAGTRGLQQERYPTPTVITRAGPRPLPAAGRAGLGPPNKHSAPDPQSQIPASASGSAAREASGGTPLPPESPSKAGSRGPAALRAHPPRTPSSRSVRGPKAPGPPQHLQDIHPEGPGPFTRAGVPAALCSKRREVRAAVMPAQDLREPPASLGPQGTPPAAPGTSAGPPRPTWTSGEPPPSWTSGAPLPTPGPLWEPPPHVDLREPPTPWTSGSPPPLDLREPPASHTRDLRGSPQPGTSGGPAARDLSRSPTHPWDLREPPTCPRLRGPQGALPPPGPQGSPLGPQRPPPPGTRGAPTPWTSGVPACPCRTSGEPPAPGTSRPPTPLGPHPRLPALGPQGAPAPRDLRSPRLPALGPQGAPAPGTLRGLWGLREPPVCSHRDLREHPASPRISR